VHALAQEHSAALHPRRPSVPRQRGSGARAL